MAYLNRDDFFKLIPARQFFKKYCPEVKNYNHKIRGIDGNKKPIDFSENDKIIISVGIERLSKDLLNVRF